MRRHTFMWLVCSQVGTWEHPSSWIQVEGRGDWGKAPFTLVGEGGRRVVPQGQQGAGPAAPRPVPVLTKARQLGDAVQGVGKAMTSLLGAP